MRVKTPKCVYVTRLSFIANAGIGFQSMTLIEAPLAIIAAE